MINRSPTDSDRAFGATIADIYERHLVPLLFEPYAAIAADRVAALRPSRVLEIAAGTGVVTRAMSVRLPESTVIVATDFNQTMLDRAMIVGTSRPVIWQTADAQALPLPDASAEVVVCQFGTMFFPDKHRAFAEMRRVLAPRGTLIFTVWDRIEHNELASAVMASVASQCEGDPPKFFERIPHGYFDASVIEADVRAGGFSTPITFDTVAERSRAVSAMDAAIAFCQGTPMRAEIEARGLDLGATTRRSADALTARFGTGAIEGKMQARIVSVTR